MNNRVRWRVSALASAVALLGSVASIDAHALALGRITVQSALGEPLRAEIEIAEITPEESGSLRAGVASAEAFKAAGLDYTPAMVGLQISLQKRADGRSFLRLSSSRPVTEPFVDLVLDATWSSGRVVRDYTMLFDPRSSRQPAPPVAPIFSRPTAPLPATIPYSPPPPAVAPAPLPPPPPRSASGVRPSAERASPAPRPVVNTANGERVAVKRGDTAGKIAAQNKPASISLDQMLVALLKSNPDAFIDGNINRLKSGAVLAIPGTDQASSISSAEASRTIVAQSRDFNEFRRKLAEGVPGAQISSADRQAGGKVQAKVEDRAPATAVPDKLTLSKGAVQSKAAVDDKIAKDRQAKEASDRVAELTKNIGDLNKLAGPATIASAAKPPLIAVPTPGAMPAAPAASAAAPVSTPASAAKVASAPAAIPAVAPAESTAAFVTSTISTTSGISSTVAPSSAASAPATAASVPASQAVIAAGVASAPAATQPKNRVVSPPPPPEPDLIEELTGNPLVLGGIAIFVALLGAFGFYRLRRKRNNAVQVDSSFLESRLQPDSFFGASGGQRIDTNEGGATGSSLVYSPSQLDAAGDVDPVAEADVYLAYGRDLQAEEILKEAMRTNPTRVAIHAKLMEIYAKRRDTRAFEAVAVEAYNQTQGDGPEWAYIGEMGRELDPANPMYQPGGQPLSAGRASADEPFNAPAFVSSTIPQMIDPQAKEAAAPVDFDLDLDFSLGDEPAAGSPPVAIAPSYQPLPTVAVNMPQDPIFDGLEMDFSTSAATLQPSFDEPAASSTAPDFDTSAAAPSANGLSFTTEPEFAAVKPAPVTATAVADNGMLEFDLGSLSLDLGGPATESPTLTGPANEAASDDPLETKFALAEEFRALGDTDGARSLAEEVASQASGSLKIRAQSFIHSLS